MSTLTEMLVLDGFSTFRPSCLMDRSNDRRPPGQLVGSSLQVSGLEIRGFIKSIPDCTKRFMIVIFFLVSGTEPDDHAAVSRARRRGKSLRARPQVPRTRTDPVPC